MGNYFHNRLAYFSKIGEKVTVKGEEFEQVWQSLRRIRKKKLFKYAKIGENYIIWRVR